jgi:hypothetical protein
MTKAKRRRLVLVGEKGFKENYIQRGAAETAVTSNDDMPDFADLRRDKIDHCTKLSGT